MLAWFKDQALVIFASKVQLSQSLKNQYTTGCSETLFHEIHKTKAPSKRIIYQSQMSCLHRAQYFQGVGGGSQMKQLRCNGLTAQQSHILLNPKQMVEIELLQQYIFPFLLLLPAKCKYVQESYCSYTQKIETCIKKRFFFSSPVNQENYMHAVNLEKITDPPK